LQEPDAANRVDNSAGMEKKSGENARKALPRLDQINFIKE
jgi:hypothetical protein